MPPWPGPCSSWMTTQGSGRARGRCSRPTGSRCSARRPTDESAVEQARRLRPQVVLLDVQLPGLDGFAVAERLAARARRAGGRADLEPRAGAPSAARLADDAGARVHHQGGVLGRVPEPAAGLTLADGGRRRRHRLVLVAAGAARGPARATEPDGTAARARRCRVAGRRRRRAHSSHAHRGPLVHALLTFPTGRMRSRLVVASSRWRTSTGSCPPLARAPWPTLALMAAVDGVGRMAVGAAHRARAAGPARPARVRRLVGGPLALAAIGRLTGSDTDALATVDVRGRGRRHGRARSRRSSLGRSVRAAATGLVVDLADRRSPGRCGPRCRRAVGDPGLEVAYRVDDGVGGRGRPAGARCPSRTDSDSAWSPSSTTRTPVAALVHDPAALRDRRAGASVGAAVRLVLANVRLQAEDAARMREVAASRRRLVEAGDEERRRLREQLRVGAEQTLADVSPTWRRSRRAAGARRPATSTASSRSSSRARGPRAVRPGRPPAGAHRAGLAAALGELAEPRAARSSVGRAAAPVPAGAGGGGVLRLLGGAGQRRQVRARLPGLDRGHRRGSAARRAGRRRRPGRRGPGSRLGPARPGGPRRGARRPARVASPAGAGTVLEAELPLAPEAVVIASGPASRPLGGGRRAAASSARSPWRSCDATGALPGRRLGAAWPSSCAAAALLVAAAAATWRGGARLPRCCSRPRRWPGWSRVEHAGRRRGVHPGPRPVRRLAAAARRGGAARARRAAARPAGRAAPGAGVRHRRRPPRARVRRRVRPGAQGCSACPDQPAARRGRTRTWRSLGQVGLALTAAWTRRSPCSHSRGSPRLAGAAPVVGAGAGAGRRGLLAVGADAVHGLGRGFVSNDATDRALWLAEAGALALVAAGVALGAAAGPAHPGGARAARARHRRRARAGRGCARWLADDARRPDDRAAVPPRGRRVDRRRGPARPLSPSPETRRSRWYASAAQDVFAVVHRPRAARRPHAARRAGDDRAAWRSSTSVCTLPAGPSSSSCARRGRRIVAAADCRAPRARARPPRRGAAALVASPWPSGSRAAASPTTTGARGARWPSGGRRPRRRRWRCARSPTACSRRCSPTRGWPRRSRSSSEQGRGWCPASCPPVASPARSSRRRTSRRASRCGRPSGDVTVDAVAERAGCA